MRHPRRKLVLAVVGFGLAIFLLWATFSGVLGPDDGTPAMVASVVGLLILGVAGYFVVTGGMTARAAAQLEAGTDVIASWRVPTAIWQRFRNIRLEGTGVRVPMLKGLLFAPRAVAEGETVEIICGARGALIDGRYFSLAPGRGVGMEQAGMVLTDPPCVAIIIGLLAGAHGSPRTTRWLLLLPIPPGARNEANKAIRHYAAAVDSVRDIGDLARAYPRRTRILFWAILIPAVVAAITGVTLEVNDYPGELPAWLGITGIMTTLGTLLVAAKVRFSGRR
ncbi:hypothetical protein [Vineibacter terrae]|uniref:hypothetical protein n=1 Tax=Vineibacter terrae TaxID=2586908 RepID=UPI0015B6B274|nr:hypothetical protein [Vineibacter terrae]